MLIIYYIIDHITLKHPLNITYSLIVINTNIVTSGLQYQKKDPSWINSFVVVKLKPMFMG